MTGPMIWQAIGWLALVLNIWGNLQLTGKGRAGWLVRLAVNFLWIGYSVNQGAWALLANHAIFVPINVVGWLRWRPSAEGGEIKRLRAGLREVELMAINRRDYRTSSAVRRVLAD